MVYLTYALLCLAVPFFGWRSYQYKQAQKKKRWDEDVKYHPAFKNPYRTKSGATPHDS